MLRLYFLPFIQFVLPTFFFNHESHEFHEFAFMYLHEFAFMYHNTLAFSLLSVLRHTCMKCSRVMQR